MKKKYLLKSASVLSCLFVLTACPAKPADNKPQDAQKFATVGPQGRVASLGSNNIYCDFANDLIDCKNLEGQQCQVTRSYDGNNLNSLCTEVTNIQNNNQGCNLTAVTNRILSEHCNSNGGNNPNIPINPNPGGPNVPPVQPIAGAVTCNLRMDSGWIGSVWASRGQFPTSSPKLNLKVPARKFLIFRGSKTVGSFQIFYQPSSVRGPETVTAVIKYKDQNKREILVKHSGSASSQLNLSTDINGMNIDVSCENATAPAPVSDLGALVCVGQAHQTGGETYEQIQFTRPINSIVSGEELQISRESDAIKGILNKETGELTLLTNVDYQYGPVSRSSSSLRSAALFEASEGNGRAKITCSVR